MHRSRGCCSGHDGCWSHPIRPRRDLCACWRSLQRAASQRKPGRHFQMTFRASVLTLYPDMFPGPLGTSLAGRALADDIWSLEAKNIRDFATDKHRSVDDTPAGGGAGMVLRPDVLAAALDSVADGRPILALTPRAEPLPQARVR